MSAPELHLDEEGYALPAPGEDSLGIEGEDQPHIGTLCLEGDLERLEYSLIEGSCRSGEVKDYLDALAEQAQRMNKACVVVLDNAPFHTSGMIREREEEWAAKGLRLYRLCRATVRT